MNAFWSATTFFTRQHLRSPLLGLVALLYVVVASALPDVGRPDSLERPRASASLLLGAGGVLLVALALVLPHSSATWRRGGAPGGCLGPRGWQAAALFGHGLLLLLAACLLASLALGLRVARDGWTHGAAPREALRTVLATGPREACSTSAVAPDLRLDLPVPAAAAPGAPPGSRTGARLRLGPRVRVDSRPEAPAAGGLACPAEVRWRVDGQGPWHQERVTFLKGQPAFVDLELPISPSDARVVIAIKHRTPGLVLDWPPESIVLAGAVAPFTTSLFRGFLLLALGAASVMAACQWFSGFVSYPLAVAAAGTLVAASAAVWSWLPGMPLADPGAMMAAGFAVPWSALTTTGAKAAAAAAVALALPLVDRRLLRSQE